MFGLLPDWPWWVWALLIYCVLSVIVALGLGRTFQLRTSREWDRWMRRKWRRRHNGPNN